MLFVVVWVEVLRHDFPLDSDLPDVLLRILVSHAGRARVRRHALLGLNIRRHRAIVDRHDKVCTRGEKERVVVNLDFLDIRADPGIVRELCGVEVTCRDLTRIQFIALDGWVDVHINISVGLLADELLELNTDQLLRRHVSFQFQLNSYCFISSVEQDFVRI